jgi:hypothetical protein
MNAVMLAAIAFALSGPATAVDQAEVSDIARLFAGEFDSYEQASMEERAQIPLADRHIQVYLIHRPVEVAGFAAPAFYVEEYRDGDETKIIRQRIVTFESDAGEGAIRMKQYFIRDEAAARGAHRDPGKLAGVTKDSTFLLPGCDVFWRREGESFVGAMMDGACVFAARDGDPKRRVIYQVTLSDFQYQRVNRSVYVDTGKTAGGRADDFPTVHKRVVGAP